MIRDRVEAGDEHAPHDDGGDFISFFFLVACPVVCDGSNGDRYGVPFPSVKEKPLFSLSPHGFPSGLP